MNESATPSSKRPSLFARTGGEPVTRAQVMGLEGIERNMGFFAAVIAFITTLLILPKYLSGKSTYLTSTQKYVAKNGCPKGYTHHLLLCTKLITQTHAYWTYLFYGTLTMGLLVAFFAWRRNRAGLIVVSMLFGLVSGGGGLLFIALAAWLLIRAFRLQRYGVATFKGSNAVARERSRERRPRNARTSGETTDNAKAVPQQSKRYTPKKQTRR